MAQALHFLIPSTSPLPNQTFSKPFICPSFRRIPTTVLRKPISISAISSDLEKYQSPRVLASENGGVTEAIEVDAVTEAELKENGFRSTRRTKLVCTIGPTTCGFEQLEALAVGGMNVARINMCHGTRDWHCTVIERVRRLNEEKGYAVAIMMDTEGSEIHMGDLGGSAASAKAEVFLEIWNQNSLLFLLIISMITISFFQLFLRIISELSGGFII